MQATRGTLPARCWSCWTQPRTAPSWTTTWTCRWTCPRSCSCAPPTCWTPSPGPSWTAWRCPALHLSTVVHMHIGVHVRMCMNTPRVCITCVIAVVARDKKNVCACNGHDHCHPKTMVGSIQGSEHLWWRCGGFEQKRLRSLALSAAERAQPQSCGHEWAGVQWPLTGGPAVRPSLLALQSVHGSRACLHLLSSSSWMPP